MKEKKLKVLLTLRGEALNIVLLEQKKYTEQDSIRGKNKIVNQLLTELSVVRNTKITK